MNCPACGEQLSGTARFCPSCGAKLHVDSTPTVSLANVGTPAGTPSRQKGSADKVSSPFSDALHEARFIPGTTLADRYRIVALAGRGGMGEVYRADDLKLEQSVALKFLPETLVQNGAALARFHREVRVARQVSHPNVCRVFDIGEANGLPFITMEYVDGEDLASLLRRIGRLPHDKALEIARQLCAGLAAAHDWDVIHRDLKPANVMIDGRGKVRITDFGLAGVAADLDAEESGVGTPAYMAPEQLDGKEATIQSDLYSLGLVLYEIFTGKRPFDASTIQELLRLRDHSTPTSPSKLIKDIDPLVERVILRCLDKDPQKRPASAIQVAAALPGGDPLAAALAAGETPSPEMVAASGSMEGLQPLVAWLCVAGVLVGVLVTVLLNPRTQLWGRVPLERPPEVLAEKAREVLKMAGYSEASADTAFGFNEEIDYLQYVRQLDKSTTRLDHLDPRAIGFWYRQSPQALVALQFPAVAVSPDDPPLDISGMALVSLDARGRLLALQAVPPQIEEIRGAESPPDWRPLFAEAGLDPTQWSPTEPKWTPLTYCDARAAWVGSLAGRPETPMRVEAAAYRGRPVYFELIGPWQRATRMQPFQWTSRYWIVVVIEICLLMALMLGGALLAWRNVRLGRGDRRGAFRLAALVFGILSLSWLLGNHHVATASEVLLFIRFLSATLFAVSFLWTLYIAFEPYVRRRWPGILVAWSRLLGGRARDPLVGQEILFGCVAGAAWSILRQLSQLFPAWVGFPPPVSRPHPGLPALLLGGRDTISTLLLMAIIATFAALASVFLLFLLRLLLRNQWAAVAVFLLINVGVSSLNSETPWVTAPFAAIFYGLAVLVVMRFGLLALVATALSQDLLQALPITTQTSAWYAGIGWFGVVYLAALTFYGFYTSLGGRPLFGGGVLDD